MGNRRRLKLHEIKGQDNHYNGIGVELASARNRRGETLLEIGKKLRILPKYLEAIEAGQFAKLPGDVYVLGFLKAYSDYLGLDQVIVIQQYKMETTGVHQEAPLEFPSAKDRGRLPTRRIIFFGFLVLIGGYGIYIFSEQAGYERTQLVSPVPERLTESEPAEKISIVNEENLKNKNTIDSLSERPTEEFSIQDSVQVDRTKFLSTGAITESNISEQDGVEREIVVQSDPSGMLENESTLPSDEGIHSTENDQEMMTTAENHLQQSNNSETRELVYVRKPAQEEKKNIEQSDLIAIDQKKENRGRMLTNNSTSIASSPQITIISKADSWVEITSAEGKVLVSRVFYSGDRFNVPEETGMFLTTGNAGALSVVIGDKILKSLGSTGEILRDFSLDARPLRERELYNNSEGNQ